MMLNEKIIKLAIAVGIIANNSIDEIKFYDIVNNYPKNDNAKILINHIKKYEKINNGCVLDVYILIFGIIDRCLDKNILIFDDTVKNIYADIADDILLSSPIVIDRKSNNILIRLSDLFHVKYKYYKINNIDDIFTLIDFLSKPTIIRENILKKHMENEYHTLLSSVYDEYKNCKTESDYKFYVGKYGYTVPTEVMIDKIIEFIAGRSVLEIGAGYGLVSYLLKLRGVNIIATDEHFAIQHIFQRSFLTPDETIRHDFFVADNDHVKGLLPHSEAFKKYSESEILLMIWPHYADLNIDEFNGKHIIFIGTDHNTPCNYNHFYSKVRESNFQQYISQSIHYPIKGPFFKYDPYLIGCEDKLIFYDKI